MLCVTIGYSTSEQTYIHGLSVIQSGPAEEDCMSHHERIAIGRRIRIRIGIAMNSSLHLPHHLNKYINSIISHQTTCFQTTCSAFFRIPPYMPIRDLMMAHLHNNKPQNKHAHKDTADNTDYSYSRQPAFSSRAAGLHFEIQSGSRLGGDICFGDLVEDI